MSARQNKHPHRSERSSLAATIHHRFEIKIPYTNSGGALAEKRRTMHREIKKGWYVAATPVPSKNSFSLDGNHKSTQVQRNTATTLQPSCFATYCGTALLRYLLYLFTLLSEGTPIAEGEQRC
jgi:hypothetical protein